MNQIPSASGEVSRRTVLRTGTLLAASLGLGLAVTGRAAAMNKAELIEAMASQARVRPTTAERALDALTGVATRALGRGDSVAWAGFGAFRVAAGRPDGSPVAFEACPELATALGRSPGVGHERRADASSRCHRADVVVDATRLARESGLSKADAKRALEGFRTAAAGAMQTGDDVALPGFGAFSISKRDARKGRNPQTGKEIKIAAKNVVKFKAGAELSKAVN